MRKPLRGGAEATAVQPAKTFDEYSVTLDSVLAYKDGEALVWFVLLVLRNVKELTPAYRVVPGVLALVTWALYYLVIRVLSHPDAFPYVGALLSGGQAAAVAQ